MPDFLDDPEHVASDRVRQPPGPEPHVGVQPHTAALTTVPGTFLRAAPVVALVAVGESVLQAGGSSRAFGFEASHAFRQGH